MVFKVENMRKSILLIVFTLSLSVLFAQSSHHLSFGIDVALPNNKTLGSASVSLGGSIEYQFKFNAPIGIQIHAGYNRFEDRFGGVVRFLPVRAGLVGYVYEDVIFISADAGLSQYYSPSTDTRQTGLSLGFGAGCRLPINKGQFLQLSGYFNRHNYKNEMFSQNYNYNWFNIRAAYGLSFGKGKKARKD